MTEKTLLDIDLLPLINALQDVLGKEPDPVRRQQAIEMITVLHVSGMGDYTGAIMVSNGMYKHITQLIEQRKDWGDLK